MNRLVVSLMLLCLFSLPAMARSVCGTSELLQHLKEKKPYAMVKSTMRAGYCDDDELYDKVYSKKTEHFQIFYTLDGPHQTTEALVDSLANDAEMAWNLYVNTLGMRAPLGIDSTHQYRQKVEDGLYPIEVLDISHMRDARALIGSVCYLCYGITVPQSGNYEKTQLFIENDFKYMSSMDAQQAERVVGDTRCLYDVSNLELKNERYNYSYAKFPEKALRVTVVHELYHAVQLRYLSLDWKNFWFEASASGMEDVGAPDVDDYFEYLPRMFGNSETTLNRMNQDYGAGVLFLYLYNHVDKKFDKSIWENFSNHPSWSFQQNLDSYAKAKKLLADSLFHDFALKLSFSGDRSVFLDKKDWINEDQWAWPNYKHNADSMSVSVRLGELSYRYTTNFLPNLSDFKGNASAVVYRNDSAKVIPIPYANSLDQVVVERNNADSVSFVFSRLIESSVLPTQQDTMPLHAYPTPWRKGNLCFTPLPQSKEFVEIRNRRGDLVTRENYLGRTLCIDEKRVKELFAPGVYMFRAGSHGKMERLMIVY
ncbi:MAG: hypothetical protein HUK20_03960 [Fibrobacter sp.]|nr:hypothetical protein [Fibrobacter sp.]